MRIVNNEKENVKIYLRNDIESSITNITQENNEMHNTIMALDHAIGGSLSGTDTALIGNCQKILQDLSRVLQCLNRCREYVNAIDTREEVSDEQYRRY